MNPLQRYLLLAKRDETQAMNELQLKGIISDNCVNVEDVAERDCQRVIEFLTPGSAQKEMAL